MGLAMIDRCPKCNVTVVRVGAIAEPDIGLFATYECPVHGEFWWRYEAQFDGRKTAYVGRPVFREKRRIVQ